MKSPILFLIFLSAIITFTGFSQNSSDSALVYLKEVSFVSPYEEDVFRNSLMNDSTDYFLLFLGSDSSMTLQEAENFRSGFNQKIAVFNTPYYHEMNDKKKVSKIYTAIHEEMLDKYTLLSPFSAIFRSEEYNCVSSSMLYALVFNALDIPYEIKLTPNHIYLNAFPGPNFITVETTDPLHGTIIYDQVFKAKFVEYLRDAKLISKDEYNQKSKDGLFEEYFNKTQTINLQALAGVQYYNQTLEELENQKYFDASCTQEKAWLLNSDATNTYLLLVSWLMNYNQLNKNDIQCAKQLGKLSRFEKKGITSEVVISEFAQITQRQLAYEGNVSLYDSSYYILMDYIRDSTLRNEISFIYNYERGRLLCNSMDFAEALPYTQEAYRLKQKNIDAKNNLLLTINNLLAGESPIKRLEFVNEKAAELPSLLQDNLFAQLMLSNYLAMIDLSFYERNEKEGQNYLNLFEQLYPQRILKYRLLESDIERAYSTAASYYFRLGQTSRSRALLEKALIYVPNSFELKQRLQAVK